ncbi:MAG: 2-amino-4-hydroxy-6-hydroxymethyldihydropteridine diphosphokinase [Endomicrobium sp.]|jgi:2-amino-4-hydroxy-6-hydroxymethyldihydropteridine diphosphokinase|nr:2-amino-4-hydroxy-6-hydroxymethyldihydropteridine diphosphokinase [Endomicrobium sp.]
MVKQNIVVYLSLGSNIGNRRDNIISALLIIRSSGFICIKKVSSFYITSPVGRLHQRYFYNAVVEVQTTLNPKELLSFVKYVENTMGRINTTVRWGPRIIDVDILFFGDQIVNSYSLTIPHKEVQNRLFVLIPLCEIAWSLKHPVLKYRIKDILYEKLLSLKHQKVKIL